VPVSQSESAQLHLEINGLQDAGLVSWSKQSLSIRQVLLTWQVNLRDIFSIYVRRRTHSR